MIVFNIRRSYSLTHAPHIAPQKDWVDNVLLEYDFALALLESSPVGQFAVLPVLCGPADERGFTKFPFDKLDSLPDVASQKTKEALVVQCKRTGVPLTHEQLGRSIRSTVTQLTKHQGIRLWALGEVDNVMTVQTTISRHHIHIVLVCAGTRAEQLPHIARAEEDDGCTMCNTRPPRGRPAR